MGKSLFVHLFAYCSKTFILVLEIFKIDFSICWQLSSSWYVLHFVNDFFKISIFSAKIVSISGRPRILPIVGYSLSINSIKLDHSNAKYKTKGLLPYDKDLNEPQIKLLVFLMEQNNSREFIVNMLSLNKVKGRSTILEKLLCELIIKAIRKTAKNIKSPLPESDPSFENYDLTDLESEACQIAFYWQHISSTALYIDFIYQNIHFPSFLSGITDIIYDFNHQIACNNKCLLKCREYFMFTLFQMLSGYIQKQSVESISDIYKLYELFYPEKEPIPLPDLKKLNCMQLDSHRQKSRTRHVQVSSTGSDRT